MHQMLNVGVRMDDELGTKQETQQDELSLDREPLFGYDVAPIDEVDPDNAATKK
jgi:hypothetical protein